MYICMHKCIYLQNRYKETSPELANLAMEVVGAYISWIDISLIANDKFIQLVQLMYTSMYMYLVCIYIYIHDP